MNVQALEIDQVLLITPRIFEDSRGHFFESFNQEAFEQKTGISVDFVQDNQSLSKQTHTVRGLHFQSPPHAQGKLVRCTSGSFLDVAVDARVGSTTYGQHVKYVLSEQNKAQLWIPAGFLHGFATLEPNTVIQYKCTDVYDATCDGSVLWNDPELNIDWGFESDVAILSEKDSNAETFSQFKSPFKL